MVHRSRCRCYIEVITCLHVFAGELPAALREALRQKLTILEEVCTYMCTDACKDMYVHRLHRRVLGHVYRHARDMCIGMLL